jgi:hypothetical protein
MRLEDELWSTTEPLLVPDIYDHEIAAMRHIEPLLQVPGTAWYQRIKGIQDIHPRNVSYLWNAEPCGELMAFGPLGRVTIMSFHKFGAPVFFKPSLAEVYASILRFVPEWKHVRFFSLRSENLGTANVIGDCHWCLCDLFGEPSSTRPESEVRDG